MTTRAASMSGGGPQANVVVQQVDADRAYSEVTRERVDNLSVQVERLEGKINALVLLVLGQLFTMLLTLFSFVIGHFHI